MDFHAPLPPLPPLTPPPLLLPPESAAPSRACTLLSLPLLPLLLLLPSAPAAPSDWRAIHLRRQQQGLLMESTHSGREGSL